MSRLCLSPPNIRHTGIQSVVATRKSGWAAPVNPEQELFTLGETLAAGWARCVAVANSRALAAGEGDLNLGPEAIYAHHGFEVTVSTRTLAASSLAVIRSWVQLVLLSSDAPGQQESMAGSPPIGACLYISARLAGIPVNRPELAIYSPRLRREAQSILLQRQSTPKVLPVHDGCLA